MTTILLTQLLGTKGQPYDIREAGGTLTYAQMATPAGLADLATYADGGSRLRNITLFFPGVKQPLRI